VKVQYIPHGVDRDGELRNAALYVKIGGEKWREVLPGEYDEFSRRE